MHGFKEVTRIVLVLSLANLVASDLLSSLETYLANVDLKEEGGVGSVSLEAIDSGKVKASIIDRENEIRENLLILQRLERNEYTADSKDLNLILNEASKFRKRLAPNGILDRAFREVLDKTLQMVESRNLPEIELRPRDKMFIFVEEITKIPGICKSIDRTQPVWEYGCIKQLESLKSGKFAPALVNAFKRLEGESELNSLIGQEKKSYNISNLIVKYFNTECVRLQKARWPIETINIYLINNLALANELATNKLNQAETELVKKAAAGSHLCSIYDYRYKMKLVASIVKVVS